MNDFINSIFAWLENRRKAKKEKARQRNIEEIASIEAELREWEHYIGPGATVSISIIEKMAEKRGQLAALKARLNSKQT